MIRKLLRNLHLFLGLSSSIIIFTVASTGCIYAFEEEIRNAIYQHLFYVNKSKGKSISIETAMGIAKAKYPKEKIKNVRIKSGSNSSYEIILKNKLSVYIDPFTGEFLGELNKDKDFFGTVLKIHRSLLLDDFGKKITGVSALIFIFMLISGIVIWWPRNMKLLKHKFFISSKSPSFKMTYDMHSVLGFYASWIIIFTAITGTIWSFKWVEKSMYWMSGSVKEERKLHSESTQDKKTFPVNTAYLLLASQFPNKIECFISLPEDSIGVFRFSFHQENNSFFKKTDHYVFDKNNYQLLRASLYNFSSLGDKIKATNLNIHTGKIFGLFGKVIVFLAALVTASLPITGFMMWRKKIKSS